MNLKIIHSARFSLPSIEFKPDGEMLVFDKPYLCTSFDLVSKIKKVAKQQLHKKLKVGHAGTLDPLASGVLIVCTGAFTKKINQFQDMEKEYTGTFILGATTPGFDMEKPVDKYYEYEHITLEMALQATQSLTGIIEQVPPLFSAIRIEGKRAFSYAREGETVEIKSRQVEIKEFELTRFSLPEIDFKIICSKGTYIRSIARDFGLALHSGAHLKSLRRTRIGNFQVNDAIQLKVES